MKHAAMEWDGRISIDPVLCPGRARIPVAVVLDKLAAGLSVDEIVDHHAA